MEFQWIQGMNLKMHEIQFGSNVIWIRMKLTGFGANFHNTSQSNLEAHRESIPEETPSCQA
jgi:hypothetical protein